MIKFKSLLFFPIGFLGKIYVYHVCAMVISHLFVKRIRIHFSLNEAYSPKNLVNIYTLYSEKWPFLDHLALSRALTSPNFIVKGI